MKKVLFIVFSAIFSLSLGAGEIYIEGFESDLYSKNGTNLKKIVLDIQILSAGVANENAIKDALNVIIGSFYAEDLMTSKGKEGLKTAFTRYAQQKYGIKVERVYILGLKFAPELDIKALKKLIEQKCSPDADDESEPKSKTATSKQNSEDLQKEANKLIEQQMKNNQQIIEQMRDFGEVDFYQ